MLTPHGDGLWSFHHASFKVGFLAIGTRTVVVQNARGGLTVISPGPLPPGLADAIRAIGPVEALVAPTLIHHLFLEENQAAFPDARTWGPPGLREKLAAQQRTARVDEVLTDAPAEPWSGVLDQHLCGGQPTVNEVAFFHADTRTLILCDLVFNIRPPVPLFTRWAMRLNRGYDRFGPTRILWSSVKDRAALRRSIDRILKWDFDRVSMAHGNLLEAGGKRALTDAFADL